MIVLFDKGNSADIFYRCGFNCGDYVLYLEQGEKRELYVPGFEYLRAKKEVDGVAVKQLTKLKDILPTLHGPFVVSPRLPYAAAQLLEGDITVEEQIFPERLIKRADELEHIAVAQQHARDAIARVVSIIRGARVENGVLVGDVVLTSELLKQKARSYLIEKGYDCPELIIASGEQTKYPHHRGEGPILPGPIIIDIFPQSEKTRYWGDMTRTVVVGDEKAERMLQAVKEVHDLCVARCVPGARVDTLYAYAVEQLAERGFETTKDSGLIHSLGHGLGIDIHEQPRMGPKDSIVLEKNMVITIEPGLYYDVGVRHENAIVVGEKPRTL